MRNARFCHFFKKICKSWWESGKKICQAAIYCHGYYVPLKIYIYFPLNFSLWSKIIFPRATFLIFCLFVFFLIDSFSGLVGMVAMPPCLRRLWDWVKERTGWTPGHQCSGLCAEPWGSVQEPGASHVCLAPGSKLESRAKGTFSKSGPDYYIFMCPAVCAY